MTMERVDMKNDVKNLKLYELIINEQQKQADRHHEKINFYTGFISLIFAGLITGIVNSSQNTRFEFFLFGPILIFFISELAKNGTRQMYRVLLEKITNRAKIEQELGLTNKKYSKSIAKKYWKNEAIIPTRYIKDLIASDSSLSFVNKRLNMGLQCEANKLFNAFEIVSVILFIFIMKEIFKNLLGPISLFSISHLFMKAHH